MKRDTIRGHERRDANRVPERIDHNRNRVETALTYYGWLATVGLGGRLATATALITGGWQQPGLEGGWQQQLLQGDGNGRAKWEIGSRIIEIRIATEASEAKTIQYSWMF